jgi:putative transposase
VPIIDERTRECLTSLVERSVTADALIDELDRLALTRGYPAVLRCDNGPELACEAMADWAGEHVVLSFIPPGEPWRNGYVESFNGRVRDERTCSPPPPRKRGTRKTTRSGTARAPTLR